MAEKEKNQIKLGAILSYVSIIVNIVAGLLYTPWMVDQIGGDDYGLFTIVNSLITLFMVDFGLSAATSRYLSKYRAEGNEEKVQSFLGAVYKLYFIIDLIIFAVLAVLYCCLDVMYDYPPAQMERLKVVYIIAGLFSVVNFPFVTFNGILTAYEKFIPLKVADLLYRVLLVGTTIVALVLGGGLYAMVSIHAVVGLVVVGFKYIVIKKSTPVKTSFKETEKGIYKEIFGFSVWVTVSALASRLVFNITPSILGMFVSATEVGAFGIVSTIEGYVYMVTTAINGMFMPKIARIYAHTDTEEDIMPLMMRVGKFQYALNGLLIIGFAIVGQSFLQLWLPDEYLMFKNEIYWGILAVIVPGIFFNSLQIANTAMTVDNKVKWNALVSVVTGVVNVVLCVILSHFFGMIGAAGAICISYFLRVIVLNVIFHKKMHFNMPLFMRKVYLRFSIPALLALGAGLVMNYFITSLSFIVFLIKGVAIVAVYLLFTFIFGLNKAEKKTAFSFVKNFLKRK